MPTFYAEFGRLLYARRLVFAQCCFVLQAPGKGTDLSMQLIQKSHCGLSQELQDLHLLKMCPVDGAIRAYDDPEQLPGQLICPVSGADAESQLQLQSPQARNFSTL